MNLNLFNNLIDSTKENNIFQKFIKELSEFLKENERNQVPLVQKILGERILTTRYRDKINVERREIINNYSKEHWEEGEFYYVYNKRSDNSYGLVNHKSGESGINIGVKESELPKGAGVDSVLKVKNGKWILDKDATEKIQAELTEMINRLLEEQTNRMEMQRVEGYLYRFVEKTGDTVWLIDETNYTGECFEEINFPSELSESATEGTMFQYINGEYQLYK